jgi:hypothetical protein
MIQGSRNTSHGLELAPISYSRQVPLNLFFFLTILFHLPSSILPFIVYKLHIAQIKATLLIYPILPKRVAA